MMAHNGELNTDRKNRLSDDALARAQARSIIRPPGQSDSSRLDQTLQSRVFDDGLDMVEAVVVDDAAGLGERPVVARSRSATCSSTSRLYEEKNDGPAAIIFSDGDVIGARLDRLGLRPLRTVETAEYLIVASEAGQVPLPVRDRRAPRPDRGRRHALPRPPQRPDLPHPRGTGSAGRPTRLRCAARARLGSGSTTCPPRRSTGHQHPGLRRRPEPARPVRGVLAQPGELPVHDGPDARRRLGADLRDGLRQRDQRAVGPRRRPGQVLLAALRPGDQPAAGLDPRGGRDDHAGRARAPSPTDAVRRLGPQIVVDSPILDHLEMVKLREQQLTPLRRFRSLYGPVPDDPAANAGVDAGCRRRPVRRRSRRSPANEGGIAVLTDRSISTSYGTAAAAARPLGGQPAADRRPACACGSR